MALYKECTFRPDLLTKWPPHFLFLIGRFKQIFSENAWPNEPKLGKKHLWKVLYKVCTFRANTLTKMAATGNSCFWLVISKKCSHLKPLGQINRHLVRSIYGRSSLKNSHFLPRHLQTWLSQAILVYDWSISKRSSLKPLRQMNQICAGGSYGRPSIKSAHFVPIHKQTLP